MLKFAVTPSIGMTRMAPPIYILAPNGAAARKIAQATVTRVNGYRITCWPTATLTHFPTGATILA